jgi:hypothetical protein
VSFEGVAAQRTALAVNDVTIGTSTCCGALVSVRKPDGPTLVGATFFGTNGKTLTTTLPLSGTYSIVVDPQNAATGRVAVAAG